jgi:Flp pilus assembly protein TadD
VGGCVADRVGVHTDALLDRAGDLLRSGRAGQAATLLAPVVGEEPDNAGAWLLLARARFVLGRPQQALDAARTALRLEPGGGEALYWVSAAYTALGRHDLALAAATTACAEEPGHPRLAERRGRALLAAGRTAEAAHFLGTATEFAHYDADLHVAHGTALFAAGRPLTAREAYSRALHLDPANERARTELRRLTAAERRIVDADSLLRVTDEYAESLRVPPGGRSPSGARRGVAAHVSAVAFAVCLLALLALAVLAGATDVAVPPALLVGLVCAAVSAAFVTTLTHRPRAN